MPQPLQTVVKAPQTIMIPNDGATKQPALAVLVTQAISTWSQVEFTLASIFVDMLGAKASPAIAMYQAVSSAKAKTAALKAAGGLVLSERNYELFLALLRIHGPCSDQRDKFCHWIWAYCEAAPEYLVLVNPVKWIRQHTALSEVRFQQTYPSPATKFDVNDGFDWSCYSITELQQIVAKFGEVLNLFRWFQDLVGPPKPLRPKDAIYGFLCTQPLVTPELAHIRSKRTK
jgi:hypothetical protein